MKNILLVDDHGVIRLGVQFLVKEIFGNPVVNEAATWQETIDMVDKHTIDMLVLDIEIPGGCGIHMLSVLRAKKPDLKILIFTAFDETLYALRYLDAGANGFIQKSAGDDDLKKALLDVSNGKHYASAKVKSMTWENRLSNNKQTTGNPFDLLSNRELEVCNFLLKGYRLSDIAQHLQLHTSTIGTYKNNIFQKLQVDNLILLLDKFQQYKSN
ncbi:response regulator [Parapedobacter tibetensis]|uniref:response regulator n=1 Tax=Parapedobacter tibetensis TaxID=2972951 RepID=UPI00214D50BC|nr:response regulator transcription factor [Parapedobacter tibetensis]